MMLKYKVVIAKHTFSGLNNKYHSLKHFSLPAKLFRVGLKSEITHFTEYRIHNCWKQILRSSGRTGLFFGRAAICCQFVSKSLSEVAGMGKSRNVQKSEKYHVVSTSLPALVVFSLRGGYCCDRFWFQTFRINKGKKIICWMK